MKPSLTFFLLSLSLPFLVSCVQPESYTPSLSPNSHPTSRGPSPGNNRATSLMDASTMTLPR